MADKNRKNKCETEMAFAAAVLLQNVLILFVLCGLAWFLHSVMAQSSSLEPLLRGGFLH